MTQLPADDRLRDVVLPRQTCAATGGTEMSFPFYISLLLLTCCAGERKLKSNSPEAVNVTVKETHLAPSGL